MSYVSFRTDEADSRRLKVSAAKRGVSLQRLMQDLVKDHLAREERGQPPALAEVVAMLRSAQAELSRTGVAALSVFGSTARGQNRSDSDIDILVEIGPGAKLSLTQFALLRDRLADVLSHRVDLVERRKLDPRLEISAERDEVRVF